MNKKTVTAIAILFLMCFPLVGISLAQNRTIGVKQGDTFVFNANYSGSDSSPSWIENTKIEQVTVTVNDVSGLRVSYTTSYQLENGSTLSGGDSSYTPEERSTWFYYANLNVNDLLFTSSDLNAKVNETVIRTYPEGAREINHVIWSAGTGSYNIYFDRKIGVLVDMSFEDSAGNVTHSIRYTLKESNVYTVPEFSLSLIIPLLVATIVLVFVSRIKKYPRIKLTF